MRHKQAVPSDPRKVGGRYFCGYWRYEYTVLAIAGTKITVRQETAGAFPETIGRIWSHYTGWDHRHDRVISQPEDQVRLPIDKWLSVLKYSIEAGISHSVFDPLH